MADPIAVKGLGKDYGKFTALGALDLTIPAGICFGYLGPNGAGKSTTIKILTNLLRPSRGHATLFGIDVQRQPRQALRKVGTVIETPEFYGYLSPLEVLAYAGRLRGMSRTDLAARSETVLKTVKLTGWADKRVETFSKGMKQRLAIAQALLHAPDLLILDEPTSGLDPIGAADFDNLIRTLQQTLGLTVFMVTHDLDSLYTICDRIAALADGKVIAAGPMATMLASEHPWLKAYFHGQRGRLAGPAGPARAMGAAGAA